MIRRSKAKTITSEDYLSTQPKNIVSCDIEDILCGDYVYILDAMDMEDFEYEDTSFDIFKEIVYKNKVVGFVSYMNYPSKCLMEAYVMPEYRGNNLLLDEISTIDNLAIHKPKISLVKSLLDSKIVTELSDGIVVSEIPFNVSSYDLINHDGGDEFYSHVYDLKNGCVLFLEENNFYYSKSNRFDSLKYSLVGNLDKDYLNNAYNIVSEYNEKYLKVSCVKLKPKIIFI